MRSIVTIAATVLRHHHSVRNELSAVARLDPAVAADLGEQLDNLVFNGFLAATPADNLADLVRYLRAIELRVDAVKVNPGRDLTPAKTISQCEDAYAELCGLVPPGPLPSEIAAIGWMLEELRVSLFAQSLGTKIPISAKRVMTAVAQACQGLTRRR